MAFAELWAVLRCRRRRSCFVPLALEGEAAPSPFHPHGHSPCRARLVHCHDGRPFWPRGCTGPRDSLQLCYETLPLYGCGPTCQESVTAAAP